MSDNTAYPATADRRPVGVVLFGRLFRLYPPAPAERWWVCHCGHPEFVHEINLLPFVRRRCLSCTCPRYQRVAYLTAVEIDELKTAFSEVADQIKDRTEHVG